MKFNNNHDYNNILNREAQRFERGNKHLFSHFSSIQQAIKILNNKNITRILAILFNTNDRVHKCYIANRDL